MQHRDGLKEQRLVHRSPDAFSFKETNIEKRRCCSYLEHDSEEDDHNCRGDKVILGFDLLAVQQHHQSECHRPSQAAVRHHHLVNLVQWDEAEAVQNPGLTNHTWSTEVTKCQDSQSEDL